MLDLTLSIVTGVRRGGAGRAEGRAEDEELEICDVSR